MIGFMFTRRVQHLIAIALPAALVALAGVALTSGAEPEQDTVMNGWTG
jgi:hypothetical protein